MSPEAYVCGFLSAYVWECLSIQICRVLQEAGGIPCNTLWLVGSAKVLPLYTTRMHLRAYTYVYMICVCRVCYATTHANRRLRIAAVLEWWRDVTCRCKKLANQLVRRHTNGIITPFIQITLMYIHMQYVYTYVCTYVYVCICIHIYKYA